MFVTKAFQVLHSRVGTLEGIHTSYHYYQGGGALARNSLLKSYYHTHDSVPLPP